MNTLNPLQQTANQVVAGITDEVSQAVALHDYVRERVKFGFNKYFDAPPDAVVAALLDPDGLVFLIEARIIKPGHGNLTRDVDAEVTQEVLHDLTGQDVLFVRLRQHHVERPTLRYARLSQEGAGGFRIVRERLDAVRIPGATGLHEGADLRAAAVSHLHDDGGVSADEAGANWFEDGDIVWRVEG